MTTLITAPRIVYIINLGVALRQSLHGQTSCAQELPLPFSLREARYRQGPRCLATHALGKCESLPLICNPSSLHPSFSSFTL